MKVYCETMQRGFMKLSPLINISNVSDSFKRVSKRRHILPLYRTAVSAGFPSPAEDEIEQALDLNELLVKHPAATFFVRVAGDSMIKAGIHQDDILVVDRSLEPANGKIVIACLNGELTVKRLMRRQHRVFLTAENERYAPIEITEEMDVRIWGVVTSVIHSV
jgi:DNA polymerase V